MEIEVLNEYSRGNGYLVIEGGKLIGIKPHLVGFGDWLEKDDLTFDSERYHECDTCKGRCVLFGKENIRCRGRWHL